MSDERKPCPFCGGGSSGGETNDGGRFIECVECGASTNLRYATGDDPWPLLVEAWNRRPADDESAKPVAFFQFDECWKTWAQVDPKFASDPGVVPFYRHPADESAKPVDTEAIARALKLEPLSGPPNTGWLTPVEPTSAASKEAKPSNNVALADLLIREICETDPADPNAEDTVCIGVDDLRLIIETCAVEAENVPVASKEAVTLSDEQRDTLQSALVALDPESICAANVRKWLAVDEIEHGVVVTNADESAKPPIFKEWFDREWDAFADKGWGDKIQSMAWALKAYRAFSEPASKEAVTLTLGIDRSAFHDKAWALYQAKALDSALLPKLSIHTIRTLWNALYDSMLSEIAECKCSGLGPCGGNRDGSCRLDRKRGASKAEGE